MKLDWLRQVPGVLPEPPKELVSLVKRLSLDRDQAEYTGVERRSEPRRNLVRPVWVQPLSESHEAIEKGFSAVSRDISKSGLSFVHKQPVESSLLGVVVMGEATTLHVIAQVERCEPLGPFYDVGCSLVMRVEPTDSPDG